MGIDLAGTDLQLLLVAVFGRCVLSLQEDVEMNAKLVAAAAVIVGLSGFAMAQDTNTSEEPNTPTTTFKALDADKDGYIEPKEAENNVQLNQNFEAVDTNDDEKISEREFMAATSGSRSTKPDMMDRVPGSGMDRSGTYR